MHYRIRTRTLKRFSSRFSLREDMLEKIPKVFSEKFREEAVLLKARGIVCYGDR